MRAPWTIPWTFVVTAGMVSGCTDHVVPTTPTPTDFGARPVRDLGAGTFTTLVFPGSVGTFALGINDEGEIVGRYMSAGHTHGFLRDTTGTYTTVDYPGSSFSVAAAINNNGAIVGWYSLAASPGIRHGFLLEDGMFTSFDPPGSTFTNALGINARGDVTGRFCTLVACTAPGTGDFHGFLLHDGEFTVTDVPNADETNAFKPQPNGAIVGAFGNVGGAARLFVLRNGEFSTFALPNGKSITEDNGGTNARGDIVGTYCDAALLCLLFAPGNHGFLLSGVVLTTIDVPGATATGATGINAHGDIVGGYVNASGQTRSFLLTRRGGAP